MGIRRFEDIESWQAARAMCTKLYALTATWPFRRDRKLVEQIRGAAVSIMANIAEGFDSDRDPEFVRFLRMAKRSVSEIQSHLYVARDQKYADDREIESLQKEAGDIKRQIGGFIRYLVACISGKRKRPA